MGLKRRVSARTDVVVIVFVASFKKGDAVSHRNLATPLLSRSISLQLPRRVGGAGWIVHVVADRGCKAHSGAAMAASSARPTGHHIWGTVELSASSSCSSEVSTNRSKDGPERRNGRDARVKSPARNRAEIEELLPEVIFHEDSGSISESSSSKPSSADNSFGRTYGGQPLYGTGDDSIGDVGQAPRTGSSPQGASWSAGSVLHEQGLCKPCVWNWKSTGCVNGVDCKFCHTCADGEVKNRKKDRICKLKAEKQAMLRAQQSRHRERKGTGVGSRSSHARSSAGAQDGSRSGQQARTQQPTRRSPTLVAL